MSDKEIFRCSFTRNGKSNITHNGNPMDMLVSVLSIFGILLKFITDEYGEDAGELFLIEFLTHLPTSTGALQDCDFESTYIIPQDDGTEISIDRNLIMQLQKLFDNIDDNHEEPND